MDEIKNRIIKTELVDIDRLTPFQGKLKTLDDKNFNKLRKSIVDEGFSFTVHVWENADVIYIIDGHQRVSVLTQMRKQGIKIPPISCSFVSAATYRDAKKLVLLAISQYGKIQKDGFMEFVEGEDFDFGDYDFPDLTFDLDELFETKSEDSFDESKEDEIPDDVPSRVQRGDVWQLGDHRLMCGDSTSKIEIDILMDGQKPHMIFTDPPYGMSAVEKSAVLSKRYRPIAGDDTTDVVKACCEIIMKMDVPTVLWGANYYSSSLPDAACWLVWDKNNGQSDQMDCELAWTNLRGVVRQYTQASEKTNRVHPTQKPVSLAEWCWNRYDAGNLILDLFLGSGSTLIAAEKTGRKCFGMELDTHYCDVIITRWETLTGKRAERISIGRA